MRHKKNKKRQEKGAVQARETKPLVNHPNKPGEAPSPSGPDFGQSIEAGGMD